ncbi:FUSC family protein [Kitasatospora sp. A2-31]|uniref:FUSC family protein n=1 Tax=Kitasatospora sp. A2-31 TaxID=2916414 RepID=UPI001EEA749D|nr:FUSC family protein [Kitasatospora sp. A2-31]MCG6498041.1 FUSC family protein [Kitasatospora sp. A2-31]
MRRPNPPDWLAHPLRIQHGPVPWTAALRGALGMAPLLAAGVALGHPHEAVLAGLGALFAGINDRAGTRRAGLLHIGVPALGGALGLLLGVADGWWAVPLLGAVGLVSGAISVAGPVSSAAAVQLLVLAAVGSGMPLQSPGPLKACCYLAGASWIVLQRLAVRPRGTARGHDAGERLAVAAVFDALADALAAVGTPGAAAARRRLTTALDRADEALRLRRLLPLPGRRRTGPDRASVRLAAASALCEAAVALLWESEPLPQRIGDGPRRLAAAVRTDTTPGPLPAPVSDTPARTAFDRALLDAGLAFSLAGPGVGRPDRTLSGTDRTGTPRTAPGRPRSRVHPAGPAGREYGLRVAVCVTVSTAAALLLRTDHWYWLPATAAFLVKPDYGPLFSRVVNRFAGTAVGVLLFAVLAAFAPSAAGTGAWWPVAAVAIAGALLPSALCHFGLQTAVITVTVLAFVTLGGDTQAVTSRLGDTAIACAIVLLVGHLPALVDSRAGVGHRSAQALRDIHHYLDHILDEPGEPHRTDPDLRDAHHAHQARSAHHAHAVHHADRRAVLRRAAYQALAQARTAAEHAAAELRTAPDRDWLRVTAGAERIADAATACAVRLEHGAPRPAPPARREVTAALAAVADAIDGRGPAATSLATASAHVPDGCRTLDDILTELRRIDALAAP